MKKIGLGLRGILHGAVSISLQCHQLSKFEVTFVSNIGASQSSLLSFTIAKMKNQISLVWLLASRLMLMVVSLTTQILSKVAIGCCYHHHRLNPLFQHRSCLDLLHPPLLLNHLNSVLAPFCHNLQLVYCGQTAAKHSQDHTRTNTRCWWRPECGAATIDFESLTFFVY